MATQSLERLDARLRRLEQELMTDEQGANRSTHGRSQSRRRGIRKRSQREFRGWPLYEVAIGPDDETGEARGHARAIFALGDHATGVVAIGGLAQGVLAIGGLSWGLVTVGGCTAGLLGALGGVAAGGFAMGGVALGGLAYGGVAIGWKAIGGTVVSLAQAVRSGTFGRLV